MSAVLCLVSGVIFGIIGYLLAHSRAGAERSRVNADRKVAEEQRDHARAQVEELRSERDEARRSADETKASLIDLSTRSSEKADLAARVESELKATQEKLQAAEKNAALMTTSAEESVRQLRSLEQDMHRQAQVEAELQSALNERKRELEEFKQDLAVARQECDGLRQQQATVDAARKELDQLRKETTQKQTEQFEALVTKALDASQAKLASTADEKLGVTGRAVTEKLQEIDQHLREFSATRSKTEGELGKQLMMLADENVKSREQTRALVEALRKPQVRGQWGELQLKRTIELANMKEHCDFTIQHSVDGDDGQLRPDMVVHLAGDKRVVVDAKVSLEAFLNAQETSDDAARERHMAEHAKQVRKHVDSLASKGYYNKVAGSPDFVIMYLPNEALLQAALDNDPRLMEYAAEKRIVLATPTVLIAMLRTVATAWTQAALQENLRQVHDLGRELHERLITMASHLHDLGRALDNSVTAYNKVIGSLESRVMVTARRFEDLKVVEGRLEPLAPVDASARPLKRTELLEAAAAEPPVRPVVDDGRPEGTSETA
ncbi:DNA recombination protein RmuC [Actinomadura geliboluensis]|uniref:DNA recombination protein RmuC n=1 Tax=Actinomadura geliboluensis TaxID=882440 RepID=UPI0036CEF3A7